jgi:hypothetical protein
LKAADHIERNPSLWNFYQLKVPDCGTSACALGWIGAFAGMHAGTLLSAGGGPVHALQLTDPRFFYSRMHELDGGAALLWGDISRIVRAMRLYADKYHPAKTPDWEAIASVPMASPEYAAG